MSHVRLPAEDTRRLQQRPISVLRDMMYDMT